MFNFKAYLYWVLSGFWHALIAYFVTRTAVMAGGGVRSDGVNGDLWYLSVTVYTCVIVIVSWKLFMY